MQHLRKMYLNLRNKRHLAESWLNFPRSDHGNLCTKVQLEFSEAHKHFIITLLLYEYTVDYILYSNQGFHFWKELNPMQGLFEKVALVVCQLK